MSGKGGRIPGAGRKRERVSVRRVQVALSATEDACLTRLEVRLRVSGAEVLRRAMLLLAAAHETEDAAARKGPRAVVV